MKIPRRGLTLTELFVVISIVGLLVAISLPAVLHVRELSRKAQCQSRLAGLGKALHAYEAAKRSFPPAAPYEPGYKGKRGADKQFAPHVPLLPFVEQSALWQQAMAIPVKPGFVLGEGSEDAPGIAEIALAPVSSYVCPSDGGGSGTNYRVCLGPGPGWIESPLSPGGGTGPFTALVDYRTDDFTDGLGQTIAMSEKLKADDDLAWDAEVDFWYTGLADLGGTPASADEMAAACSALTAEPPHHHPHAGRTWMFAAYAHTWYNHALSPNGATPDCTTLSWPHREASNSGAYKASSRHSGGVNVLLMDGAVRFVADGVDLTVWRALSTRAGGETVTAF
ncbi:MAG: DUF1559 domain-containing protein [Planctomycetaceae bacterium]